MTTTVSRPIASPLGIGSIARIVAWTAVVAFGLFYVRKAAIPYLLHWDAATYGPFWSYATWLLPHILSGMLALLIGPMQFWTALRRRFQTLHRWAGRVYLVGVGFASSMAVGMLLRSHGDGAYRSGLAGLVVAWISTTALAYVAIRRGNIAQHREWMVRSYVVTFAFVGFRLLDDVLRVRGIGTSTVRNDAVAWACWAAPLLVTELVIQARKILRTPARPLPALPD